MSLLVEFVVTLHHQICLLVSSQFFQFFFLGPLYFKTFVSYDSSNQTLQIWRQSNWKFLGSFVVNGLIDVKIMYLITKCPYYLSLFYLFVCLILRCERVYLSLGNKVLWFENIYQTELAADDWDICFPYLMNSQSIWKSLWELQNVSVYYYVCSFPTFRVFFLSFFFHLFILNGEIDEMHWSWWPLNLLLHLVTKNEI